MGEHQQDQLRVLPRMASRAAGLAAGSPDCKQNIEYDLN